MMWKYNRHNGEIRRSPVENQTMQTSWLWLVTLKLRDECHRDDLLLLTCSVLRRNHYP